MNNVDYFSSSNGDYFLKLQSLYPELRRSEQMIADYIIENPSLAENMNLKELAESAKTSDASVMRFCHALGYSGFPAMKLDLARGVALQENAKKGHPNIGISPTTALDEVPERIIARSITALEATLKVIQIPMFKQAVDVLKSTDRITFFGMANSSSIADDALNKFIRLGKYCRVISDTHLQVMTATNLCEKDVVIGFSHSGKTKEIIDALVLAKKSKAKIIVITNFAASQIAEIGDITLVTADFETSFYSETMASRICQLAIVDMLYLGVMLSDYENNIARIDLMNENLAGHKY